MVAVGAELIRESSSGSSGSEFEPQEWDPQVVRGGSLRGVRFLREDQGPNTGKVSALQRRRPLRRSYGSHFGMVRKWRDVQLFREEETSG